MTDTRHWCHEGKQGPHPLVAVGNGEFVCPAHPEVTDKNADPLIAPKKKAPKKTTKKKR